MTNIIELARQAGLELNWFDDNFPVLHGKLINLEQLIRADEREKSKVKSFAETCPYNPHHTCKCEHWEACDDCHPGCESAIRERGGKRE